jgi:hypothetical protein
MKSGMSIRQLRLRNVVSEVLHAAVWCGLLVGVGYGQTSQDQVNDVLNAKVGSVIEHLKQGRLRSGDSRADCRGPGGTACSNP